MSLITLFNLTVPDDTDEKLTEEYNLKISPTEKRGIEAMSKAGRKQLNSMLREAMRFAIHVSRYGCDE